MDPQRVAAMEINWAHYKTIYSRLSKQYPNYWFIIQKGRLCGLGRTREEVFKDADNQSYFNRAQDYFCAKIPNLVD